MTTLTAIIFIFWPDEKDYLETCLKSVSFADEIVVINNGANEETVKIAQKYSKKIFDCPDKSFAARHNFGAEKATSDWLLFIDADERVSIKLQKEIKKLLEENSADVAEINRVNFYLGKKFRFGDRYPDWVKRLFKKSSLKGWTGEIHETSQSVGKTVQLSAPLYHFTHRNIFTMVEKTINFSEHEAKLRMNVNHPPVVWWRLVRVFLSEFFHRVFILQGWREGTQGWIDGIFQAFSLFIVYARLWEMQQKPSLEEKYKEYDKKILQGDEI